MKNCQLNNDLAAYFWIAKKKITILIDIKHKKKSIYYRIVAYFWESVKSLIFLIDNI